MDAMYFYSRASGQTFDTPAERVRCDDERTRNANS